MTAVAVERMVVVVADEWIVVALAAEAAREAPMQSPAPTTTTSPYPRTAVQCLAGCLI